MTDTGIFATTAEIGYKAGAGKSSVSSAETYTNSFIAQAESFINISTMFNWSDVYTGLNVDLKYILKECGSSLAAIYVINYDMSGYSSRQEALIMINILWARVNECLILLQKASNRDFLSTGVNK